MGIMQNQFIISSRVSQVQSKIKENLITKGIVGLTNESISVLADKILDIQTGGSGVLETLIEQGRYYSAQSFLEQQLRDSYETTKDWTDYSKARGSNIVYAPEFSNVPVSGGLTFSKCINLRISPNVKYNEINACFADCYNLYQFKGDTSACTNWTNAFANCSSLEIFEADTSSATRMESTFMLCRYLKRVLGLKTHNVVAFSQMFGSTPLLTEINPINFSSSTSAISMFNQYNRSNELRTIVVEGAINVPSQWWADNLSIETLRSIIAALTDRTGQPALTISFTSSCVGRLEQQDKDNITNKNWTLATV